MRRNVFRDIAILTNDTEIELTRPDLSDERQYLLHFRKNLLSEITNYLETYKWLRKEGITTRIKTYRANGYDIATAMSVLSEPSKTAFDSALWAASRNFKAKIGETTIDLIHQDRDIEARRQFLIKTGSLSSTRLLSSAVVDMLPPPSPNRGIIYASSCKNELKFLKSLTLKNIESVISRLDSSKLAFLRHLLDTTDPSYSKQRELVYQFLEGDIETLDTALLLLKDVELVH